MYFPLHVEQPWNHVYVLFQYTTETFVWKMIIMHTLIHMNNYINFIEGTMLLVLLNNLF